MAKGKGKDLSRMPMPSPTSASTAAPEPESSTDPTQSDELKGKDLSRLASSSSAQGPPVENVRRENVARIASGIEPVDTSSGGPASTQQITQPTQRPLSVEARLSTLEGSSSTLSGSGPTAIATTPSASENNQGGYGRPSLAPMLGEKLQSLCNSIDSSYTLDSEVQERLVEMADSFVDKVTKDATKLARHRGSSNLEVVDVALALKKGYNMEVPGLGPPSAASGGKGGWLFADKVNPREEKPKKKQKNSGPAATAAAM